MTRIPCTPTSPDISGVGVRTATYAQILLSFLPAIYALQGKKDTRTMLKTLEKQSMTMFIIAFAILISTIVQALTRGIADYQTTAILNLSWINNTNTFVYLLLYVYHKREKLYRPDRSDALDWVSLAKKALQKRVMIIGSLHLFFMAFVGLWFGSRPAERSHPVSILSLVPVSSTGLRRCSTFIYALLLIPGWNLIVPAAFFIIPYAIHTRTTSRSSRFDARATCIPVIAGLAAIALINVISLVDIEIVISKYKPLLEEGGNTWTFGQILAVLLLLVPARDLIRNVLNKRPLSLVQTLPAASKEGQLDVTGRKSIVLHTRDPRSQSKLPSNMLPMSDEMNGMILLALMARDSDLQYLAEHGADIKVEERDGKTAPLAA